MSNIHYLSFKQADSKALMAVVNEDALRKHLVDHPYFDETSIQAWVQEKIDTDEMPGCRVRVVVIDGVLAGWCGIQPDEHGVEIAGQPVELVLAAASRHPAAEVAGHDVPAGPVDRLDPGEQAAAHQDAAEER